MKKEFPMLICRVTLVGLLALLSGMGAAAEPGDASRSRWTAFQGPPAKDLQSGELPLTWSPTENVAWNAAIAGYGQSSPVVWGTRVFVTSVSGPMKQMCHVAAFDLKTGEKLWQRDFPAAVQVENTNYVSKAAPSPVVDGDRVVALFESGNLVALGHDGETQWSRNLVEQYGELSARHGLASSLIQTDDLVFAWIERQAEPYLLAIEKATGETRWKTAGLGATSWSTPALTRVGDEHHLVLSGSGRLAGVDAVTGKPLWSFDGLSGNTVPTPQSAGEAMFLMGASVGRGEETAGAAAQSNGMLAIKNAGGDFQVDFQWRSQRATSSFGSPIVHQGLAYFVNQAGVLYCLDAGSGDELYTQRLADSLWATPLAVGDRIYFPSRSGTTTVVQAGETFRKLAENRLWNEDAAQDGEEGPDAQRAARRSGQAIQYAIAAVPGRLLIRTGDRLYCVAGGE